MPRTVCRCCGRRGSVSISVRIGDRDAVIQYVQAGSYLGETSLLEENRTRTATVTATTLTETILLPAEFVRRLLDRSPGLLREFRQRQSDQVISNRMSQ